MATELMPWVVVSPSGVSWLGHASDESGAWSVALGWPDDEEIAHHRRQGWYAAEAMVTWTRPMDLASPSPAAELNRGGT